MRTISTDVISNPVVSILRIVSFIQLGNKTGEDINCKLPVINKPGNLLTRISIDNFIRPALWSATEVAIAIFSCSIPSLTYLFRRAVGSTSSESARQLRNQSGFRNSYERTAYQRGNDTRQNRRFQNLRNEVTHVDNIELNPNCLDTSATVRRNSEKTLGSYGLNQIMVKKDFDVRSDESAIV